MRALLRIALRCGYALSRFSRRRRRGAAVAVVHEGRVLVVRHSYRDGQSLPGGAIRRSETPDAAAVRELREETGIPADAAALRPVYADLRLRIFEYRPVRRPPVAVDGAEVVEAGFLDPEAITEPDGALRSYLLCRAADETKNAGGVSPPRESNDGRPDR